MPDSLLSMADSVAHSAEEIVRRGVADIRSSGVHRGCMGLLCAAAIASCGDGPSPEPDPSGDSVLRVVLSQEPANLDPLRTVGASEATLSRQVFQAPLRYQYLTNRVQLRPALAESMPVVTEDLLSYTVRLRAARFADDAAFPGGQGREVTSQDLEYSIKRHFDPGQGSQWKWLYQGRIQGLDQWGEDPDYDRPVSGLEVVDDRTLRIHLTEPYPVFLHLLASPALGIVPREAVEAYGQEFGRKPVGTGPYRLVELTELMARFVRNPNHDERLNLVAEGGDLSLDGGLEGLRPYDGEPLPLMPEIEVQFVVDNIPAFLLFTASPPADVGYVANEASGLWKENPPPDHRLSRFLSSSVVRFGLNLDGPLGRPTADHDQDDLKALRCAMASAMDWEERNVLFYQSQARMHPGIIPPGFDGFDGSMDPTPVTYDLESARQRLQEHGWTADDLPSIVYGHQAGTLDRQGFEHFRTKMENLGFPADKVVSKNYATFGDLMRGAAAGEFDVYLRAWLLDYPDAENVLSLYYGPNAPAPNFERFQDPEYDAMYEQILRMPPGPERSGLMDGMNRILIRECVFMGSVFRHFDRAVHRDLVFRGDTTAPLSGIAWRFAVRNSATD